MGSPGVVLPFYKYVAYASDFILVDNRDGRWSSQLASQKLRAGLCDRRLGVGGDAVMEIVSHPTAACHANHYLPTGELAGLCGNGSRCVLVWAHGQGLFNKDHKLTISMVDGLHEATYNRDGTYTMQIRDILDTAKYDDGDYVIDLGILHHVRFVDAADVIDVDGVSQSLQKLDERHISRQPEVMCVNFVNQVDSQTLYIRTYECEEILSCGTGSVAAAVSWHIRKHPESHNALLENQKINVQQKGGGELIVSFTRREDDTFKNICLTGTATHVFDGQFLCN